MVVPVDGRCLRLRRWADWSRLFAPYVSAVTGRAFISLFQKEKPERLVDYTESFSCASIASVIRLL